MVRYEQIGVTTQRKQMKMEEKDIKRVKKGKEDPIIDQSIIKNKGN